MSVNPGFGGQSFIENTYQKVRALRELITNRKSKALIEIDGGVTSGKYIKLLHWSALSFNSFMVTSGNAKDLVNAGADVLVAGSFVFKSDDPTATIKELKESADQ